MENPAHNARRGLVISVEKCSVKDSATTAGSGSGASKVITLEKDVVDHFKELAMKSFTERLNRERCSECGIATTASGTVRHVPWDDIELKKHQLMNTQCQRYLDQKRLDEFEMKRSGYVDTECQHYATPFRKPTASAAVSTAASVAEEVQKGVRKMPLSECEKSSTDRKIAKQASLKLPSLVEGGSEASSSMPSSITLRSLPTEKGKGKARTSRVEQKEEAEPESEEVSETEEDEEELEESITEDPDAGPLMMHAPEIPKETTPMTTGNVRAQAEMEQVELTQDGDGQVLKFNLRVTFERSPETPTSHRILEL